jgi:hypothetical protein
METYPDLLLLLFNLTVNGFLHGSSGTKIRYNTQKYTYISGIETGTCGSAARNSDH